jgi:hypothetical protein
MSVEANTEIAAVMVARSQPRLMRALDLSVTGCVGASLLVLMLSGEFPPALLWTNVLALGASLFVGRSEWVTQNRNWINVVLIIALFFFVWRSFEERNYLYQAVLFLSVIQVVKLFQRTQATDVLQILALAILGLIVGAIANPDIIFLFSFLVNLVLMTWALLLLHFFRDAVRQVEEAQKQEVDPEPVMLALRRRVSGRFYAGMTAMSLVLFLATASIFILFPRMGLGFLFQGMSATSVSGFADSIDLGHHGSIDMDGTTVARVDVLGAAGSPPPTVLYLRGRSLDLYEKGTWIKSYVCRLPANGSHRGMVPLPMAQGEVPRGLRSRARIYMEPIDAQTPVVLVPSGTEQISIAPSRDITGVGRTISVWRDLDGDVLHDASAHMRLVYDVEFTTDRSISLPGDMDAYRAESVRLEKACTLLPYWRNRFLQVPAEQGLMFRGLVEKWSRGATDPTDRANRVEAELQRQYRYTLAGAEDHDSDPVEHFLFTRKEGHCEYFAASMVLLLRSDGVPARVVNGFAGGEWNRGGGFFTFRREHAHSWVEAYIQGKGWVRFDPTPRVFEMEPTGFWANLRLRFQRMKLQWMVWVVNFNASRQIQFFKGVRDQWRGAKKRFNKLTAIGKVIVFSAFFGLIFLVIQWLRKRRSRGRKKRNKEAERERKFLQQLEARVARHFRPRHPSEPPATYLRRAARHIARRDPVLKRAMYAFADNLCVCLYAPNRHKARVVELRREAKILKSQIRASGVRPIDDAQECPPPPDVVELKQAS